jgi:hypothetical protein
MAGEITKDQSAVEYAIEFVATQAGGAERILEQHYPMPSRVCAGCAVVPTEYPCQAARIAEHARQHPKYRDPRASAAPGLTLMPLLGSDSGVLTQPQTIRSSATQS